MEILRLQFGYWLLLCLFMLVLGSCREEAEFRSLGVQDTEEPSPLTPPVEGKGEISGYQPVGHLDTALSYVGTVEVGGDNKGPEIKKFLGVTDLPEGYAWCAAFVSYCLDVHSDIIDWPTIRSARAQDFITRRSIKASSILMGIKKPSMGSILIWKKGNGRYGHTGFVADSTDQSHCFVTVEGNTSPPSTAELKIKNEELKIDLERNGDGVYSRYRCIEPGNYFRIVSFTDVRY